MKKTETKHIPRFVELSSNGLAEFSMKAEGHQIFASGSSTRLLKANV